DIAAVPEIRALVRMQEALFDHAVDHPDQGRVEILDVEEGARLAADAELAPGEHLEDLLHGAEPAGQGDERVGQLEHAHLAIVSAADETRQRDGQGRSQESSPDHVGCVSTGRTTIPREESQYARTVQHELTPEVAFQRVEA